MMFCYSVCKHSDALDHCASLNTLDHIYNRGLPGLGSDRDVSNPEEIGGSREFRGLVGLGGIILEREVVKKVWDVKQ